MTSYLSGSFVLLLGGVGGCSVSHETSSSTSEAPADTTPGVVEEPVRCVPPPVDRFKELAIVDATVVEDAERIKPGGPWSFRHLVEEMAPPAIDAPTFVETWVKEWNVTTVNSFPVPPKTAGATAFLAAWPRTADGKLDLGQAPFKLIAITNRMDLRDKKNPGSAGEGRLIFAGLQGGQPANFTVIFEYVLPTDDTKDVPFWADTWHGLGAPAQGERYNAALEKVTRLFTDRGASPSKPNGSAIGQIRTNELMLGDPWELREFRLDVADGQLRIAPTLQCPDPSFNHGNDTLVQFINDHADEVRRGTHVVPPEMLGGVAPETGPWEIPGVDEELRHAFALQTCNGCHTNETKSRNGFFHVAPTGVGRARLSVFLDNADDAQNDELSRRAGELSLLLCGVSEDHTPPSSGPGTVPLPE
jgi:hypothetical protein